MRDEQNDVVYLESQFKKIKDKKRPLTAVKDMSRITGDFEKAKMLQNTIVDNSKRVNFNSQYQTETSMRSQMRRSSRMNSSRPQTARIKSITNAKGVRPQTAKNYYTQNINKNLKKQNENRLFSSNSQNKLRVVDNVIGYNADIITESQAEDMSNLNVKSKYMPI